MGTFEVGTVIQDQGKVGVIKNIVRPNTKLTGHKLVDMRKNYEIYYYDGHVGYLGCKSLNRLVAAGHIKVLYDPNSNNNFIESLDN